MNGRGESRHGYGETDYAERKDCDDNECLNQARAEQDPVEIRYDERARKRRYDAPCNSTGNPGQSECPARDGKGQQIRREVFDVLLPPNVPTRLKRSDHGGNEVRARSDSKEVARADEVPKCGSGGKQVYAEIGEHYSDKERVGEEYLDISLYHSWD